MPLTDIRGIDMAMALRRTPCGKPAAGERTAAGRNGFLWLCRIVIVPATDAAIGSAMAAAIDIATLAWLATLFAGFYMGGHTDPASLFSHALLNASIGRASTC